MIMKKILLSALILSMVTLGFSQKHANFPKEKVNVAVQATVQAPLTGAEIIQMPVNPNVATPLASKDELIAGTTKYDLQSNSLLGNRVWLHEDGTAGAVWTMGLEGAPGFSGRGTGYNYFDGSAWGPAPDTRIEDDRCGWPSYAAWGENGEIVVSHLAGQSIYTDGGLMLNKREEKGVGDWTEIYIPGSAGMGGTDITWPRVMTSGTNHEYIHIIVPAASAYADQDLPLLYIRSNDGGETWTDWTILEEINSDYYNGFSADDYTWAESRGDVIAFTISSPWHDWIIMKSTDNGENWEKIIPWEHPYPFFDWNSTITTDTIWAPDNSADIAIDENGLIHAVCGLTRVAHTEVGTTYSYWPWTDGIIYWDETMEPFTNENQHYALKYDNLTEDVNYIGWVVDGELMEELLSYRELGMSTMPNITADNGQIVVVWSSITPGYHNGQFNFRHIWTRRSYDNGAPNSWGELMDINTDIAHWLDECIYPVLAGSFDDADNAFFIYNTDATPGTALDGDHDYQTNTEYVLNYIPVGIENNISFTDANVSQNYPNPATGTSVVNVTLPQSANLSIEVTNLMGQVVYTADKGAVNAGMHSFTIDASNLGSGVYFYTVKAGESSVTKKMIVE